MTSPVLARMLSLCSFCRPKTRHAALEDERGDPAMAARPTVTASTTIGRRRCRA
jgi:hypothetical protein